MALAKQKFDGMSGWEITNVEISSNSLKNSNYHKM
jgi:hypothetical protein